MLKIVFDVPRRTTRNDIIFHASDKVLIAGLRVSLKRQREKKKGKFVCVNFRFVNFRFSQGKPATLRGKPLHALNAGAFAVVVTRDPW